MNRLIGILKVGGILCLDFAILFLFSRSLRCALCITGFLFLYVWSGGFISLHHDHAIAVSSLSDSFKAYFSEAIIQMSQDSMENGHGDLPNMKFYLIEDDGIQGTSYGANCISVTRGLLQYGDSEALKGVLAHELSHSLNLDPEFSRAVFASVFLLMGAISIVSFAATLIVLIVFLLFGFLSSWLGFCILRGTNRAIRGSFHFIQRTIAVSCRLFMAAVNRHAEYRCDLYAAKLGYGVPLAHLLSLLSFDANERMTLSEILYQNHPPVQKRIARLKKYQNKKSINKI